MDLSSKIIEVLSVYPDIRFVILFGSQNTGHTHAESDIDLAIASLHGPLSFDEMSRIKLSLSYSLDKPIDLVDLLSDQGPILNEVFSTGRVLLQTDDYLYHRALCKMLAWEQDFAPLYRQSMRFVIEQRLRETA